MYYLTILVILVYCQKKLNEIDEEENNILDEGKIKNEQQ